MLVPDELHRQVWEEQVRDGIAPGNLLLFGHGFSIHYGEVEPHAEVVIVMVAMTPVPGSNFPAYFYERNYTGKKQPNPAAVKQGEPDPVHLKRSLP